MRSRRGVKTLALDLAGSGVGLPPQILKMIAQYQDLERKIEAAYEGGKSAVSLEGRAQVLLEKIESSIDELTSEESGDLTLVPVDIVTRQFIEAYNDILPIDRRNVDEFIARGGPKWVPPYRVCTSVEMWNKPGSPGRMTEGYWEYPNIIHRLREIVGNSEADGMQLLEAARDANDWYIGLVKKLKSDMRAGRDPVSEAKNWIRKVKRRSR